MPQLVTLGETMAMFSPGGSGPLRYISEYRLRIAGAESNVAVGVAKLGHTAGWVSRLGKDEFGVYVRNMIRGEGVDTSCVVFDPQHPTGLMFKQMGVGEESQVFYYRGDSAAKGLCPQDISEEYIAQAKILHLTGITPVLGESCCEAVRYAIQLAKAHGVLVSFDPNVRRKLWEGRDYAPLLLELVGAADVVLIGLEEAQMLLGTGDPQQIFRQLFDLGVSRVALKDGKRGAWVGEAGNIFRIPPMKCTCVDSIGAGDAFAAAFLVGTLENRSIELCGRMGAIAGALVTQTTGDIEGYPSGEQMERLLRGEEAVYR